MYYPLSQITSNLHTNGEEYMVESTKLSYSGYYWKTSKDEYFTGKTPQDTPTEKLVLLVNKNLINVSENLNTVSYYDTNDNSTYYLNLTNLNAPGLLPTYSPTLPTQQNYQIGEFRRFFCKKTNELMYLEINSDTYNKLVNQDSTIAYQYYQPFNVSWQLTGSKEQVYTVNKNIVELIIFQRKLPQFDLYLKKDYIKYYK
jgi:hypothetical protein